MRPDRAETSEAAAGFSELYSLIIAPIKTRLLLTGIELGVFDHLGERRSAEDLAEILGGSPERTRIFLDGLAAFDLVIKREGLYQNSVIATTFLVGDGPTYVGNFLTEQWRYIEPVCEDLTTHVVDGPPKGKRAEEPRSREDTGRWAAAVAEYQRAGVAEMVARAIGELPEFPSFRRMLDLGGGPGLISVAVVASHPVMRGAVFDLPPVAEAAERFVREAGMEGRVEVVDGDFSQDAIGGEYDLILASASLYSCRGMLGPLMEKVRDALNPGGVFVSLHDGLTNERTKPTAMKLGWLPAELLGGEIAFDRGEIASSMRRAGFTSISSRTLSSPVGPMEMDVGRKPGEDIYPGSDNF